MFNFISHKFLTGAMILLLLLSIICQIIIGVLYQNMIKDADNMSATTNKLLKQCKLKFSNCFLLNMGVSNISIFVDKFISRIKIVGISLGVIGHISGQLMLLSVFLSGIGICKGIIEGKTLGELLPYYIISLFGLYVYFSVSSLVDLTGKKRILKTNLVDYLENSMVSRLNFNMTDEIASKECKQILLESSAEEKGLEELKEVKEPPYAFKKEENRETRSVDKIESNGNDAEELEQLLEKLFV